jgi:N-sulfoglucosamine sulfohydrolase
MKQFLILLLAFLNLTGCKSQVKKMYGKRPNIIWIMIENWGHELSCYGAKGVYSPNIDRLASEGIRFTNSFCTSSVSSPSRSAMMTGFQQLYIGCDPHRKSGPGYVREKLPYGIKPIPVLLQDAGYFTCLMDRKTDCNFITERPLFMGKDWSERKAGQPFFAQISFNGTDWNWQKQRPDTINRVNMNAIEIPPYYPDLPITRRDYATGYECLQKVDKEIGRLLKRIDDEGLTENTLVFFIADNGISMPRGMQFLYDEGLRVPIIARWPAYISPGQVSDNLVMTIDISATILDAAGVNPGYKLHGNSLFSKEIAERKYIFASRDKMDWTFDAMRAIRSREFKLIQNLMPERPYCQFNQYKETCFPILALLNMMNLKGELTPDQAKFMAANKPEIELYDVVKDPYELNNLADDPKYLTVKKEMISRLMEWRETVKDPGISTEFRKGGWPSTYPTRSPEEWTEIVAKWEKWLFAKPDEKSEWPDIKDIPGAEPVNLK